MLKHNEENKPKLLNIVQQVEKQEKPPTKKRPSRKVVREPSPATRPKKKQKIEVPINPQPSNPTPEKPLVSLENLELPTLLQKLLAEDYDQVVNHKNVTFSLLSLVQ